jgi:hypothetical protein
MITIPVTVTGDHWLNPEQLVSSLALADPKETVVLDLHAEGPSLHRLGVIDAVLDHCARGQRDPTTVFISRWSNPVEDVPFQRSGRADISHFYWGSDRYWPPGVVPCVGTKLWGFFMGRPTLPRLLLLRALAQKDQALLSRMVGGQVPDLYQGLCPDLAEYGEQQDLMTWYHTCGITSLDGHSIRDQYRADKNTNASLLNYYDQFQIEIVAESYCLGNTFFPTEKTVRPLSAGKPMLVMGPRHFLRRLRDQGFRTWGDLWDETYDELEGLARLSAILDIVTAIEAQLRIILPSLGSNADHNRDVLQQLVRRHRPGP